MFYCNLDHVLKNSSQKPSKNSSAVQRFHYITRIQNFENHKENIAEKLEFVQSGNMPYFAQNKPDEFWQAAHIYERKNGRVCSSLVVALPKELTAAQRSELAEQFIAEFADRYQFPYSCAIHNHQGSLGGQEQPHLHLMYSERSVDEIERTPEQFFKRYNPKNPQKGGAQKLTADVLGFGKSQLTLFRQKTEELINDSLQCYAPTKTLEIRGLKVEVQNRVSCLSNEDYNKQFGTDLQDVPMMPKKIRFAKNGTDLYEQKQEMTEEINRLRAENRYEKYKSEYELALSKQQKLEQDNQPKPSPRYEKPRGYDVLKTDAEAN